MIWISRQIPTSDLVSPPAKCPVLLGRWLVWRQSDGGTEIDPEELWYVWAVHRLAREMDAEGEVIEQTTGILEKEAGSRG